MLLKPLADRTRFFKETPEGVEYMCKAMEDRITDEKIRFAARLIKMGKLSLEDIAKAAQLSIDKVMEIDEQLKPASA